MRTMISHYKQIVVWFYIFIFLWPLVTARINFGRRSSSSCQYGRPVTGRQPANNIISDYIVSLGRVTSYKSCVRSCCRRRGCNMVWMVGPMCYLVSCPQSPLSGCLINSKDADSSVIPVRNVNQVQQEPNSTISNGNNYSRTEGMTMPTTDLVDKTTTSRKEITNKTNRITTTVVTSSPGGAGVTTNGDSSNSNNIQDSKNDDKESQNGLNDSNDSEGSQMQDRKLGSICSTTLDCHKNEFCWVKLTKGISNCICKREYIRQNNVCVLRDSQSTRCNIVNGEGCDQNEECVIDHRRVAICQCKDEFTRDPISKNCVNIHQNDNTKHCQADDDCPHNSECVIGTTLRHSKCLCRNGFVLNGDNTKCVLKADNNKSSDHLSLFLKRRCSTNIRCPPHASCETSKHRCFCQEGSRPDSSHILCILNSELDAGKSYATPSKSTVRATSSKPIISTRKTSSPTLTTTSLHITTRVASSTAHPSTPSQRATTSAKKYITASSESATVATQAPTTQQSISTKTVISTKTAITTKLSFRTTVHSQLPTATHIKELQVDVGFNRNITLPVNSITIYGAAWPPSPKNHPYSFEWSKVFSPANSKAIIAGQHTALLSLSNIDVPGVYGLKLTVRSEASYGHGFVNVTVFPAVRNNKPPVAVIYPKFKEITLPIQKFVLDGSRSSDDDKIVKYEWELVAGPLNYYLKKKTNPVLQLTKLDPGNYDFKLTVTDSDGVKNSTLARIKVNKAMDYKPVALPGPDVLLYLPQNSVVLNGSGSYDDNGIVRYAWTKLHGSPEIADMQGTTSPVLHVTNLVEGHYVFQLNVTDTAGQMASATVTVVVQPEDNKPPKAVAGPDKDLVSPDDSTFLDGSSSSDDRGIVSYLWRKVSGPNAFVMSGAKTSQLKLTKLKLGTYVFELIVTDDRGLQGKDTVNVFVKKDDNKAPVAKINGDVTVKLPKNEAVLNGSLSSDDYGIVRYEWTRSSNSPAIATILEDSDHKPILRLAGLVVGKYTFTLKVVDQKGLYSVDKATITVVKGDAMENLVEVKIDTQGHTFTNQNKMNLLTTISLSLGISGDKIKIDNIHEINSGGISVVFYIVDDNGKVQKGAEIVSTLKSKAFKNLNRKYWIVAIDTYLCHNNCSGHGVCDNLSKRCVCNSFWMENFIKAGIQGQSNCEWSILYVIIICASCVIAIVSVIWFILYCCRRRRNKNLRRQKFTMLEDKNSKNEMKSRSKNRFRKSNLFASDSDDSDEDTLFDANSSVKNHVKSTAGSTTHNLKLNGGLKRNKTEKV